MGYVFISDKPPKTPRITKRYPGPMAQRRNWTRDESLIAFRLYCGLPFGKLNHQNPEIIRLADKLGRTPSSVSMKACNFARLDPLHQARGVAGLTHGAKLEEQIWEEFHADSEAIADEAEAVYEQLAGPKDMAEQPDDSRTLDLPDGPSETLATVRIRRVQGFFRRAVLTSYGHRCCLTGLAIPQLLNASHIIPWSTPGNEHRRADPSNGLCLNALHDRAFDRGLMTFDEDHRVILSKALRDDTAAVGLGHLQTVFAATQGQPLTMPDRFAPSKEALAYHRVHVFHAA